MDALSAFIWGDSASDERSEEELLRERSANIAAFRAHLQAAVSEAEAGAKAGAEAGTEAGPKASGDGAGADGTRAVSGGGDAGGGTLLADVAKASERELEAFLVARDYDLQGAASMWLDTQAWRRSTFPVQRTEGIERILKSSRYPTFGFNNEDPPRLVLGFDSQWGAFLNGEDEEELLLAFLVWFEEQLALVDAQGGWYSIIHVAIGGRPPMQWTRRLTSILEANYPERLHKAVIFPAPWLLKTLIDGMLWFLPSRTRGKFALASDLQSLADACEMDESEFPENVRSLKLEAFVDYAMKLQEEDEEDSQFTWDNIGPGCTRIVRGAHVPAWETKQLTFIIEEPVEWLEWTCGVDLGYDIGLQVTFEPALEQEATGDKQHVEGAAAPSPLAQPTKGFQQPQLARADAVILRQAARFQGVQGPLAAAGELQHAPATHADGGLLSSAEVGSSGRALKLGSGALRFELDNSYSWVNSKNVLVQVTVQR